MLLRRSVFALEPQGSGSKVRSLGVSGLAGAVISGGGSLDLGNGGGKGMRVVADRASGAGLRSAGAWVRVVGVLVGFGWGLH